MQLIIQEALNYASLDWYVFPCKNKRPLTKHGFKDATVDVSQIKKWWEKHPHASIGIATGKKSNIVVLDIDPRNNGKASFDSLIKKQGKLPVTVQAKTGGGGKHFYFRYNSRIKNVMNFYPGIDIKSDGGYVIAPPSIHESGKTYSWQNRPDSFAIAKAPIWMENAKPVLAEVPERSAIEEGRRNSELFNQGAKMRKAGISYEAILSALSEENKNRCIPPLTHLEVEKIAKNSMKYISLFSHNSHWLKPLEREAYYGLVGEVVKIIGPHSEADPAALLFQFLACFGNVIGNKAHFLVEDKKHALKINLVIVGKTSKSRKGTSWGRIVKIFEKVEPKWIKEKVITGLSSGEGLIFAVSDKNEENKLDKRILVIEEEFASTLKVMGRDKSILSPIIRQAWDSSDLNNLTKNNPLKASDTHITVIGHITIEELRKCFTNTEMANGFGNRFLWVCVKRSKFLSRGGNLKDIELIPIIEQIKKALKLASSIERIDFNEEAGELWDEIYPTLSEGRPGLVGALIARTEAYVLRVASIYALLDCSKEIRLEHLRAALAVCDYSSQSVEHSFKGKIGDSIAETILLELKKDPSNGLNKKQIHKLFNNHMKAFEIDNALRYLSKRKLVKSICKEKTGGRPEEIWITSEKKEK